jgi:hypothetical protein
MRALLCFLTLVVASAPARADDREDARREFAAGQASDKQKDWQTALEHYLRAYELVPHPFAIYNIATDYERLGKLRESATWYTRYLEAAPDSPDRDKVQKLLGDLRLRPTTITVRSIPEGATVIIDGRPAGPTPFSGPIRGGGHRIAVEKDGQHDERDVSVEYGEPADVQFTLRGVSGTLAVQGVPAGAQVTVDGMPAGAMPLQLIVQPGPHSVHVTEYGYTPFDVTVDVRPNTTTPVIAQLQRGGLGTYGGLPSVQIGYFAGGAAGADLKGSGALLLAELGLRAWRYDASLRVGKGGGGTSVDLLVRWTFAKARLSPFIAFGYSFANGGQGYEVAGGLRFDVAKAITMLVETGLRYHATTAGTTDSTTSLIVPLLGTLQLTYR